MLGVYLVLIQDVLLRPDKTQKAVNLLIYSLLEYSERDLNPHNRNGHKILSLACLPFHHPSRP